MMYIEKNEVIFISVFLIMMSNIIRAFRMGRLIYILYIFCFLSCGREENCCKQQEWRYIFFKKGRKLLPLGIYVLVHVYVKCPDAFGKRGELIWILIIYIYIHILSQDEKREMK